MSQGKVENSGFYETSYGRSYGYNARAQKHRQQFFDNNWKDQYPSPEILRRQNISKMGYGRTAQGQTCGGMYNRSTQVRDTITDQQGLIGPGNVDTMRRALNPPDRAFYDRPEDEDLQRASQLDNFFSSVGSGARAIMPDTKPETRRSQQIIPKVRWSSRKTAENRPGFRELNYDTEYTDKHNNFKHLGNRASWVRDTSLQGPVTTDRDYAEPARTRNQVANGAQTTRYITHSRLWNMHPSREFVQNVSERPTELEYRRTRNAGRSIANSRSSSRPSSSTI